MGAHKGDDLEDHVDGTVHVGDGAVFVAGASEIPAWLVQGVSGERPI